MKKIKYTYGDILSDKTLTKFIREVKSTCNSRRAVFECELCGGHFESFIYSVKSGDTGSCGCRKVTHNQSYHPLYNVWKNMISRTENPKDKSFLRYGARGISVHESLKDLSAFISFSESIGWEKGLQIDRIDNNGNYEPKNIRFVTQGENMKNTSKFKYWIVHGVCYGGLTAAALAHGVGESTIKRWCEGYSQGGKTTDKKDGCFSKLKYEATNGYT